MYFSLCSLESHTIIIVLTLGRKTDLLHFANSCSEQTHLMESIIFCETSERLASTIVLVCLTFLIKQGLRNPGPFFESDCESSFLRFWFFLSLFLSFLPFNVSFFHLIFSYSNTISPSFFNV